MDLQALKRFQKSVDEFRLTKLSSKRDGYVATGHFAVGRFTLHEYPETATLPEAVGAQIVGVASDAFLRTSPIVKIVDQTDSTTVFETQGGVYRLEKV